MAITTFPVTYSDGSVLAASDLSQNFNALNNATVPVGSGGTGLASGTSGGLVYFSASGTIASSGALTQYGLLYGGGAGAPPVAMAALAAGSIVQGTATAPAALAIGTANQIPAVNAGATALAYVNQGFRLVGSTTTEGTDASNAEVTLVTVTVSITAGTPFLVVGNYRKTAGAAAASQIGLRLNSTTVAIAAATSTTNQAEDGSFVYYVGPQNTANHTHAVWGLAICNGTTTVFNVGQGSNATPNATVTSVIIRGVSGSASITVGVSDVFVYSLATS